MVSNNKIIVESSLSLKWYNSIYTGFVIVCTHDHHIKLMMMLIYLLELAPVYLSHTQNSCTHNMFYYIICAGKNIVKDNSSELFFSFFFVLLVYFFVVLYE